MGMMKIIMSAAAAPADTRDRILDAAEVLFADSGFAGTSVRDLAQAARLTPAALYNHFESKQALYEAVLERGVRPLLELMQTLAVRDHTPTATHEIIAAIMEHLGQRPHLPRLIQHEAVCGGEHLVELARTWIRPLMLQGIGEMKRDEASPWDEDEYPLVISAWLHLVFGHFAMAPLLAEVFDADPLSAESLERQTRFFHKLALQLMGGSSSD